jgi:hypothetical protein
MPTIPQNVYALVLIAMAMGAYVLRMPDLYVGGLISAGLVVFNSQSKGTAP